MKLNSLFGIMEKFKGHDEDLGLPFPWDFVKEVM